MHWNVRETNPIMDRDMVRDMGQNGGDLKIQILAEATERVTDEEALKVLTDVVNVVVRLQRCITFINYYFNCLI